MNGRTVMLEVGNSARKNRFELAGIAHNDHLHGVHLVILAVEIDLSDASRLRGDHQLVPADWLHLNHGIVVDTDRAMSESSSSNLLLLMTSCIWSELV